MDDVRFVSFFLDVLHFCQQNAICHHSIVVLVDVFQKLVDVLWIRFAQASSVSANEWKMAPRACSHGQRWLNLQRSDSLMWTQVEANSADRQENFWQCLCFLHPLEPTRNLTFPPGNVKYFPIRCFFTILSFSLHFIFHSDKIYQQWMHRS